MGHLVWGDLMRKFFFPVIFVVVLIISFSFSTFAAAEPFYVFDLSNLDAISFYYIAEDNQTVVTTESYNPMGFMSFVVEGTNDNRISDIDSIFNFDFAAASGANPVYLQSGISYFFELYAWNVYYLNSGDSSQKDNFIDRFVLTLKSPQGDLAYVRFTDSMFTSELEYVPQIRQNAYRMSFTLDGSLYSGYRIVALRVDAVYSDSASDGVVKYIQAFCDFNISAVNVSDKHWDQNITGTAPPGSDQANSNHNQEQDILNSISGGVSDSNNLFSNAISLWSDWVGSIALVTRIFNSFTDLPVISVLLVISLSFGISGFLFNLGSSFVRRDSRSKKGGG